jgi:hypothetical protein
LTSQAVQADVPSYYPGAQLNDAGPVYVASFCAKLLNNLKPVWAVKQEIELSVVYTLHPLFSYPLATSSELEKGVALSVAKNVLAVSAL